MTFPLMRPRGSELAPAVGSIARLKIASAPATVIPILLVGSVYAGSRPQVSSAWALVAPETA
jgi:hypothetical protein